MHISAHFKFLQTIQIKSILKNLNVISDAYILGLLFLDHAIVQFYI